MTERIYFGGQAAWDPQRQQAAVSASVDFFALSDPGNTSPLPAYNALGTSVPHVVSSAAGWFPDWSLDCPDGTVEVRWVSGAFSGTVLSWNAAREKIELAQANAAAAQAAAESSAMAAAALAAASGMPSGGSDGQVLVRRGGSLTFESVPREAADVAFTPTGAVSATTVQGAIEMAAQMGSSGGTSSVLVVRRVSGAWPALPSSRPAGVDLVQFVGAAPLPTQSSWPSWAGLGDGQVPVAMLVTAS